MQAIDAYPIPPSPLYSRPYLLGDKTVIQRDSPKRYAQGYMVYTVHWTYHYILPNPSLILPTLR
jgi:hypothetical protein